jgi:hypothetical protein
MCFVVDNEWPSCVAQNEVSLLVVTVDCDTGLADIFGCDGGLPSRRVTTNSFVQTKKSQSSCCGISVSKVETLGFLPMQRKACSVLSDTAVCADGLRQHRLIASHPNSPLFDSQPSSADAFRPAVF